MDLEEASALTPLGDGRYGVDLRPEFAIRGDKPNGGSMLHCLGQAAVAAAGAEGSTHAHPIATGAQYQRSPDLGPAVIETEVSKVGRTASQVTAVLLQDESPQVMARFTLGTLPVGSAPFWGDVPPVELAPLEKCVGFGGARPDNGFRLAFDPEHPIAFGSDGPSSDGSGELRAWFIRDDGGPVDPVTLLYICDGMPPSTFTVVQTGWAPTLDLTVHVRAIPAPGPLRVRCRVRLIQDGFADESCEMWDSTGRFVAESTQMMALRLPG
jgi:hypothetical protein